MSDLEQEPEPDPEPKQEPQLFQSRNLNCNKSWRFHNTAYYLATRVPSSQFFSHLIFIELPISPISLA